MQKHSTLAALVGGLLVTGSVASATVINGYDWDNVYTGDQIPTATDTEWTVAGGDGSSAQHLTAGTITLTSPFDNYMYIQKIGDWAPSPTATSYAEFKVKVDGFVGGESSATTLNVFTAGGGGMMILLRAAGVHLLDGVSDPEALVYALDTSAYHVYRVAASSVSDTYSVSVDGVTIASNLALNSGLNFDILRIGDAGSNTGGVATYEYVAFNNASAPIQVPEPAGAAVLGLIGAAALRRRRD